MADIRSQPEQLELRLDEVSRIKESHRISEATVDHTQGKTRFTSLRLGRELQRRRSG